MWCNDTHWVDHSITRIPDPGPPKKSRRLSLLDTDYIKPHSTGSARTQGNFTFITSLLVTYIHIGLLFLVSTV